MMGAPLSSLRLPAIFQLGADCPRPKPWSQRRYSMASYDIDLGSDGLGCSIVLVTAECGQSRTGPYGRADHG